MGKSKVKITTVSERKTIDVRQGTLVGQQYVWVDVCAECSAIVFDPIDHYQWHRKLAKK